MPGALFQACSHHETGSDSWLGQAWGSCLVSCGELEPSKLPALLAFLILGGSSEMLPCAQPSINLKDTPITSIIQMGVYICGGVDGRHGMCQDLHGWFWGSCLRLSAHGGPPPFAGRFSEKAIYPKEKPTGSGLSVLLFLKLSGNEV